MGTVSPKGIQAYRTWGSKESKDSWYQTEGKQGQTLTMWQAGGGGAFHSSSI